MKNTFANCEIDDNEKLMGRNMPAHLSHWKKMRGTKRAWSDNKAERMGLMEKRKGAMEKRMRPKTKRKTPEESGKKLMICYLIRTQTRMDVMKNRKGSMTKRKLKTRRRKGNIGRRKGAMEERWGLRKFRGA